MDNQYNQTEVAYEIGPKEVNRKRGMHDGNKQFGKNKMPQDQKSPVKSHSKPVKEKHVMSMRLGQGRHKESR